MNTTTPRWPLRWLALAALLAPAVQANEMHPDFPLLDASGTPVVESGAPLSTLKTCGACHDTAFIAASSDHADAGASRLAEIGPGQLGPGYFGGSGPLRYDAVLPDGDGAVDIDAWLRRDGGRHVGGGPAADRVEMDCLLCHTAPDGRAARADALAAGEFAWANSAPLASFGLLARTEEGWAWNPEAFDAEGQAKPGRLMVRKPADANCAQCHGIVEDDLSKPLTITPDAHARVVTERTGQVFSPQRLTDSGLNLHEKATLEHPFDVHADRVVACVDCHHSLNNPAHALPTDELRPSHLDYDPRRLTVAEYLERPMHQFAKGRSAHGLATPVSAGTMRRCASCHDAGPAHAWLPYSARHFNALACESCHVPTLYGPALESVDWTMLDGAGEPLRRYRGIDGDIADPTTLIRGFEPILLPRPEVTGETRLAPFNVVTSWYWAAGEPARPVPSDRLAAALRPGGDYHPDLVAALDRDGDGRLAGDELRLDDATRLDAVRARLANDGIDAELAVRHDAFSINHDVVQGRWATRECADCHGDDSRLNRPFTLAAWTPGGMKPDAPKLEGVEFAGHVAMNGAAATLTPALAGYYILGLHDVAWIDRLGLGLFLAIWAGVLLHATGRWISNRRHGHHHGRLERVYMYDAYERLWHWLQALAILLLLFTGLVIHKPGWFGAFSFAWIVNAHNVLGFILLANAALSLFYHLASGEVQQYLPEPRGFIHRAVQQALYYSGGIFRGEGHPFEKTRGRKLNPLQQVTYLGILNVLLPVQIITGVLVWGAQRWPDAVNSLGGLPLLAPLHTLTAWLFASFIVMHVYLTTASGHTPAAGIQSMITGWEEVEHASPEGERSPS